MKRVLLGLVLLVPAIASRLDIARNKGFHPNLARGLSGRAAAATEERASKSYRYRNGNTEKFFVESMPDIPQSFMTEMYSGLIPIDEEEPDRALFFIFQPRIGGPPVDEITIWMNGGPGCSSLEGFLQENGYIRWTWGQYAPTVNDYSWVNLTNVLWVEQPVGTGFSTGQVRATSEEDIAGDFIKFFKNFQTTFGIKNYKTFVTGESYAGRYVPYIANAMLEQNDTCYYDVQGALMYDPVIGAFDVQNDMTIYPFVEANNNVLGYNASFLAHMKEMEEECGFSDFRDKYMQYPPSGMQPPLAESKTKCALWNEAYYAAYAPNPCFNVYMLGFTCPLLSDPLGYPTDLQLSYPGLPVYFNRTDVKKAMHAPMDVEWLECAPHAVFKGNGGPEGYGDTSPDPIQNVLPHVIEATNRVLVSNGALDMDVLTNATLLAIQNMTWNGMMGFQSGPESWKDIVITLPDLQYQGLFEENGAGGLDRYQGIMGKQHFERGLIFAETYLSGHMQPQFQPRSAYRHLQWVLGRIEHL
ncbi:uncharacterized protein LTR77_001802 [Saxophila tyrrhenica]|uniref:Carboxypeptidase n=1 Tax=Saxophila tyrrhenica TaxID=1690608 RepID=A0AAV9PLT2_9PEZI|nr:hypothetical protein LTR77_001802 [Saxophila tyrrhenica]